MGYFAQRILIVTVFAQGVEQFRHPRHVTEIQRHDGPVKIGTESHVFDTDAPSDIVDVTHNFRKRRIRLQAPVLT